MINRSIFVKAAAAVLAVAGLGAASMAQARDNINWSVGIGVPGVVVGASNYGYNNYPVYTQPAPIYSPAPVYPSSYYVQPAPIYYSPPVYVRPAPVYIGGGYYGHRHGYRHHHRGHRR